jgi:hypothetical protein
MFEDTACSVMILYGFTHKIFISELDNYITTFKLTLFTSI